MVGLAARRRSPIERDTEREDGVAPMDLHTSDSDPLVEVAGRPHDDLVFWWIRRPSTAA